MNALMSAGPGFDENREFLVDNSFTIFLQEEEKTLPYFAAKIDDISKFQTSNKKLEKDEELEKLDKVVAMYKTIIDKFFKRFTVNFGRNNVSNRSRTTMCAYVD